MVIRIQTIFKTVPTPENWEIESKEDHLTVIKLSETDGFTHNKLSNPGTKELENKNVLVIQETSTSSKTICPPETNMGKDKYKDKEQQDGETATSTKSITSPWDTHQFNRDLSRDREARDATLAKTITKAVAREMAKAHAQYQALLNDRSTAVIPTSLKITSGANSFKVMDPFDWTKDKAIYQRWQLWSEKARLTLDAMEGDSEKTKISYFHHWINGEGMGHTEPWKNNKTLIHQSEYDGLEEHQKEGKYSSEQIESYFILFESLLAPKSNPLLAVEELHFANKAL